MPQEGCKARLETTLGKRILASAAAWLLLPLTTGSGTAELGGRRPGAGLEALLTSLKMVRRFCAITLTHAIFPIIGK